VIAPGGPFAEQLTKAGIQFTEFASASKGVITSFRSFRQATRKCIPQPDLIHVHGAPDLLLFASRAKLKQPKVLTVHGFHGKGAGFSYRFAALVANRLAKAVICVAGSEEQLLLNAGVRPGKLHRIYNGVADPCGAQNIQDDITNGEANPQKVRITFVGRLEQVKGIDVLIRAFAMLEGATGNRDKHSSQPLPAVTIDLLGVGAEEDALRNLAAELGVADKVTFLGYCPDAAVRLAGYDIFCLPSREDMGPLVCVEAMAQGKPVISTLVGGIPEMVDNGVTGLLVPSDDVKSLAVALERLVRDRALRTRMGHAGRDRYEALFTQESMAKLTFDVYKQVLRHSSN
jgi:glycosyltransferase involved in cell wall biosynthesis